MAKDAEKPASHFTVQVTVTETIPAHKVKPEQSFRDTITVEREVSELAKFTLRGEDLEDLLKVTGDHIALIRA